MPEFLANITPLIVFLGIAAIGFVFLLISLVVGDIFDSFGFETGLDGGADGHALLDSRVISVFVTAFGGFGAIGIQMGLSIVASSLLGLGGGLSSAVWFHCLDVFFTSSSLRVLSPRHN